MDLDAIEQTLRRRGFLLIEPPVEPVTEEQVEKVLRRVDAVAEAWDLTVEKLPDRPGMILYPDDLPPGELDAIRRKAAAATN